MTAAARLVVTRVPNIAVPRGGVEVATWQRVYESLEITRRNFDAIRDTLNRAIGGGTLIAPGSITLEHLADSAKVIIGDVVGELGASSTVEKLRNILLPTPAAGNDGQVITYDHAGGSWAYSVLPVALTDHGALTGLSDDDHGGYLLATGLREWVEQGSDPSTPSANTWKLYFKAGGLYVIDDAGTVTGPLGTGGGGGGTFLGLTDTPAAFTSQAGKYARVNAGETALEFATPAGSSPLTTKGDVHTYDTADQRLPVGSDGQVLTADAAEATGLKWATPESGGGSSGGGLPPDDFDLLTDGVSELVFVGGDVLWITGAGVGGLPPDDFDLMTDGDESLIFADGEVVWVLY